MVKLPYSSNTLRCVYSGTYMGCKWANVFHMVYGGGPASSADISALATALRQAWDTNLKSIHGTQVTLTGVTVTDLSSDTAPSGADTTTVAGTRAMSAPLPANVAMVISWKTSRRYRGGHARNYMVGFNTTDHVSGGLWASATITSHSAAWAAWRAAINALTYTSMPTLQLVSLSYYNGKALRVTPTYDSINDLAIHSRVDTMRRRLGREITA